MPSHRGALSACATQRGDPPDPASSPSTSSGRRRIRREPGVRRVRRERACLRRYLHPTHGILRAIILPIPRVSGRLWRKFIWFPFSRSMHKLMPHPARCERGRLLCRLGHEPTHSQLHVRPGRRFWMRHRPSSRRSAVIVDSRTRPNVSRASSWRDCSSGGRICCRVRSTRTRA
jgi:hypothetical protein